MAHNDLSGASRSSGHRIPSHRLEREQLSGRDGEVRGERRVLDEVRPLHVGREEGRYGHP